MENLPAIVGELWCRADVIEFPFENIENVFRSEFMLPALEGNAHGVGDRLLSCRPRLHGLSTRQRAKSLCLRFEEGVVRQIVGVFGVNDHQYSEETSFLYMRDFFLWAR